MQSRKKVVDTLYLKTPTHRMKKENEKTVNDKKGANSLGQ